LRSRCSAVDGGLIVQLRPDGYTARPVVCDEDTYRRTASCRR
jgi:hypothetical protein